MTGDRNIRISTDRNRRRLSEPAFATRAIHHGYDPVGFSNAVQPPVFLTSTYGFESVTANDAAAALGGKLYAREHNPTTEILEARLASLEGAEAGLAVASGMAAFGALGLSLLSQGDELIVHKTLYVNTVTMIEEALPRFGIRVLPVDLSDPDNLDAAITDRSLGDADSLICHPASLNRARQKIRADAHMTEGVGEDLIRLSVGLEDPEDLIADLSHALEGS